MSQRALWDVVVVGKHVVVQSRIEFGTRGEPGLFDNLTDAAIEALNHAIGLRMTRRSQTMFNVELLALFVKDMLARRLLVFAGEAVGELCSVVRQQLGDFERRGLVHTA